MNILLRVFPYNAVPQLSAASKLYVAGVSISKMVSKVTKKPVKKPVRPSVKQLENATVVTRPEPKKPAEYPVDQENNNVRYWLIKSEPYSRIDPKSGKDAKFSLADLKQVDFEPWDGVRNHEAKNNMLNMRVGDICLFYHSNAPVPGLVGIAKVTHEAHPDSLQFDPTSTYYDAKSSLDSPRWWCVDVSFVRRLKSKITLESLRSNDALSEMSLVKRGRLSVSPVRKQEYYEILEMENSSAFAMDIDCDLGEEFTADPSA